MDQTASKITSQGQVSVPAEVRRRLHLTPGATLVWQFEGDRVVVTRAQKNTTGDVHAALFPSPVPARSLQELKQGLRKHIQKRHARP